MELNESSELNQCYTKCQELVRCTAAVLTDENLQALFISTQENSLELAMEYSIRYSWLVQTFNNNSHNLQQTNHEESYPCRLKDMAWRVGTDSLLPFPLSCGQPRHA